MVLDKEKMKRDLAALGIGNEELRPPFDRALELCVEMSGPGSEPNWRESLLDAQGLADRGVGFADDELRLQSSSLLVLALLAQLGAEPQEALVRELSRRADAMRVGRTDSDARVTMAQETIDGLVATIRIAIKVARACAPTGGS